MTRGVQTEMQSALVTGGTGFIGRHVVHALARRGIRVEALVRQTSDLSVFEGVEVQTVVGDVLDERTYQEAISRVDLVIHMASLLKMPWSPRFREVHVEGTEAVARTCAAVPERPCLLLVSSLAASGPHRSPVPPDEGVRPAPVSVYGRAKRDAELRASAYSSEVPLTIIRPPAVYGPWDRTLLKLFRSVARGVHLVPGNGGSLMSMVQVEDLAAAIVEAGLRGERVEGQAGPHGRGVYFIAGDEHPPYGELGHWVSNALGVDAPRVLTLPRFAARWAASGSEGLARLRDRSTVLNRDKMLEAHSGHWTCQSLKAARDLDWRPSRPLQDHLRDTALWYRSHGWLT